MRNTALVKNVPFIDITKYEEFIKKGKKECVWNLDNIHSGPVEIEGLFEGQIEVPICERHYTWHCAIITLVVSGGMEIEDVVEMSRERCLTELAMRGLIPLKV